jgi:hypothetical protein
MPDRLAIPGAIDEALEFPVADDVTHRDPLAPELDQLILATRGGEFAGSDHAVNELPGHPLGCDPGELVDDFASEDHAWDPVWASRHGEWRAKPNESATRRDQLRSESDDRGELRCRGWDRSRAC